ncbi:MAG: alanyl-tRNA editing protein [Oscillospiraceae bacterium]|nr:alanyl-tRNA editing protein [Oscillospiraceae bacterium]
MTEKLYYKDSHLFTFEAAVLDCREEKKGYSVVLDKTAFFPEGGGQLADTGVLGGVRVLDVHERGGEIRHYTDAPLEIGAHVEGCVDAEQRLRRMQNHSGEHILSGLIHNTYGFDNVGFHMGAECMIIDFSGELSWEQLTELETRANEVVRQNIPLHIWFPDENELKSLEYRSKLELTENVRIVEIPGVDRCACCAPHVERTGEVGIVKILDSQRHRGGVRVSVVCGLDALEDYRARQESVTEISRALSAKRGEVTQAVQRVLNEQQSMKERCDALSLALIRYMAEAEPATAGNILVFDGTLGEIAQRELANLLMEKAGGFAAVFCGSDEDGWRYIIGSKRLDLRAMSREINAAVQGRGGGTPQMIQGSARANRAEIEAGLKKLNVS